MSASLISEYVLVHARKNRVKCPTCTPHRKTKNEETLSIKDLGDRVVWHCWHCPEKGAVRRLQSVDKSVEPVSNVEVIPLRSFVTSPLTDDGASYLEQRGISRLTADTCGVVSGAKMYRKSNSVLDSVGFSYNHNNQDYAIKWRSISSKEFTQDGAAATLYLADKLTNKDRLVITEGEMDAISFWEAGIEAVSIPSGAIQAASKDESARLKWMALHDELISGAKDVYLAVDEDGPGQTTAQELARRIGKAKCWKVTFPPGCKDANDVLIKHGKEILSDCITNASRWPIEGISSANDFADKVMRLYNTGLPRGLSTGWLNVDEIYTLNPGNLVIITGVPGHGKSTFLDALLVNAMKTHNWNIAYASFENPQDIHISKLIAQKVGKPFGLGPTQRMSENEVMTAMSWVNDHVTFLTNDGVMPTVESLIERFETAVRRYGVKACVVDPFNFIKLPGKEGGFDTESINDMLSQFKMFAQRAEVVFFLVAHPAKPMAGNTDFIPTGYSISGCHDDATEVLTERGWIPHPDVTLEDVVACFDLESGNLLWDNPTVVHRYEHNGEMHHYSGYSMDIMVTPNHRMVVKNYWGTNGRVVNKSTMANEKWRFINSEDMPRANHLIPLATHPQTIGTEIESVTIGGVSYDADDFLSAVGWFISEGWTAMKAPCWCQAVGSLQERMSLVINRLGFPITEAFDMPQGRGIQMMWRSRMLRTKAPELCDWFIENCGVGALNKKIPDEFMKLGVRQLRVLLDALIDGDGSVTKSGFRYHTTSTKLADQVQEIAIRCGMSANIASYGRVKEHHKDRYTVNINKEERKVRTLSVMNNRKSVEYNGEVFCLTVPTGAYITRRNGMMAITGNSAHFYNRADFGLTMQRKNNESILHVWKARFAHQGRMGNCTLEYDPPTGGFHEPNTLLSLPDFSTVDPSDFPF